MLRAQTNVQAARLSAFKPATCSGKNGLRIRTTAPKAKVMRVVRVQAVLAPAIAPAEQPQWGKDAPEHVAEWRRNLDLNGFGAEMKALERKLKAEQGAPDVKHLKGVLFWSNACYFSGLALAGVCNPMHGNIIAGLLMSTGIFARWTMVGHHVSHGGYNGQQKGKRFHRSTFAKGFLARSLDWLDWMLPEAWDVEHNNLHHYKLGESGNSGSSGDPDLVERNLASLRDSKMPMFLKYAQVAGLMAIWKWYYYAPNTLKEMYDSQIKRGVTNSKFADVKQPFDTGAGEPNTLEFIFSRLFQGKPGPLLAMLPVLAPYFIWHFVMVPLPFYLLGGQTMGAIALANMVVAELATNIHSFIAIATNHAGDDMYRFETDVLPKTPEFYLRAVISSVNYRTADTTPDIKKRGAPAGPIGNTNDFMHGWLNYQIEHHMFPDLSMLSYQKAKPIVKDACERYGIPYVQESVWKRLNQTANIMVGKVSMKQWERGD